jgi:hypothetical protein
LAVHTEDLADGSHIYEAAPATLNPHHSAGRSLLNLGEQHPLPRDLEQTHSTDRVMKAAPHRAP